MSDLSTPSPSAIRLYGSWSTERLVATRDKARTELAETRKAKGRSNRHGDLAVIHQRQRYYDVLNAAVSWREQGLV